MALVAFSSAFAPLRVIPRGGQVCRDTILEPKGPGLMPLVNVAPVYNCVVAGIYRGGSHGSCLGGLALSACSLLFSVLNIGSVTLRGVLDLTSYLV